MKMRKHNDTRPTLILNFTKKVTGTEFDYFFNCSLHFPRGAFENDYSGV